MTILLSLSLLGRLFLALISRPQLTPGQRLTIDFCLENRPYWRKQWQIIPVQKQFLKLALLRPRNQSWPSGQCFRATGKIQSCPWSSNYDWCLIIERLQPLKITSLSRLIKNYGRQKLSQIRQKCLTKLRRALPSPEAELLAGISLGLQENFAPNFYRQLQRTGTLHIVVASGYNLSVIGEKFFGLLTKIISYRFALILSLMAIWSYIGLADFQPPVVRAGVLLSLLFLSRFLGRKPNSGRNLFFTVWLILMIRPDWLFNISFQLSLLALTGLILSRKLFLRWAKLPIWGQIWAETITIQLLVGPLIAWRFGQFSWLAPLSNSLILPLVPLLTVAGLVALILPTLLSQLLLWLIYPGLYWLTLIITQFSQLPGANWPLKLTWWQLVACYLILFAWWSPTIFKADRQ